MKVAKMISILYDGKCKICSKEINYYKNISKNNIFTWYDITNEPKILDLYGISQEKALLYLHAVDKNSNIHIGVDAFILIWKNLKYWNILAIFVSIPIVKTICNFIYKIFAKYRFSKLSHCQLSINKN